MIHPYKALKQMKCPWLDSLTEEVKRSIAEYDKFIMAEAEADKCIDFAKESFLYERFVDNNFYGMDYCNIEVLKYFAVYVERKIIQTMIGEWHFTEHDQEMYEYFKNTKFDVSSKFVDIITKYCVESPYFVGNCKDAPNWNLTMDVDNIGKTRVNYIDLFIDCFISCNDMIRNVKSLGLVRPSFNLFNCPIQKALSGLNKGVKLC